MYRFEKGPGVVNDSDLPRPARAALDSRAPRAPKPGVGATTNPKKIIHKKKQPNSAQNTYKSEYPQEGFFVKKDIYQTSKKGVFLAKNYRISNIECLNF